MLLLGEVDVSDWFPSTGEEAAAMHPGWAVDPLMVSSSSQRFNRYAMSAAMLSNDQATVGPVRRLQVGVDRPTSVALRDPSDPYCPDNAQHVPPRSTPPQGARRRDACLSSLCASVRRVWPGVSGHDCLLLARRRHHRALRCAVTVRTTGRMDSTSLFSDPFYDDDTLRTHFVTYLDICFNYANFLSEEGGGVLVFFLVGQSAQKCKNSLTVKALQQ